MGKRLAIPRAKHRIMQSTPVLFDVSALLCLSLCVCTLSWARLKLLNCEAALGLLNRWIEHGCDSRIDSYRSAFYCGICVSV